MHHLRRRAMLQAMTKQKGSSTTPRTERRTFARNAKTRDRRAIVAAAPPANHVDNNALQEQNHHPAAVVPQQQLQQQEQQPTVSTTTTRSTPPTLPFEPSPANQQSVGSTMVSYALAGFGVTLGFVFVKVLFGG
jgi:hypothetical protein